MATLAEKIVAIHKSLRQSNIPHAFGGALALAWCTAQARGTIDIDCNIFVGASEASKALAALPTAIIWSPSDRAALERDGQTRLFWDKTPIDLFLNTSEFHERVAERAQLQIFAQTEIPFLSCSDLAVFKAFFNRTKDWADIEAMIETDSVDAERVVGVLALVLGPTDDRVARFVGLVNPN